MNIKRAKNEIKNALKAYLTTDEFGAYRIPPIRQRPILLMGLIYGGQVQAMLPRVKAKNYEGMELIRPLYFTREQSVLDWAEYCGLTFLPCDCPAKKLESDTKRAEIKQLIAYLAANNPQIEANIFNAVKNVDTAKLLGWRDENGRHSFLDRL